nr:MAG TPA: hypothetical protein [Caudoviricetes sp.]
MKFNIRNSLPSEINNGHPFVTISFNTFTKGYLI